MPYSDADHFRALYEVARTISSTLSLPQVLTLVVESAARAMDAKACSIRLRTDLGTKLELAASYGLSDRYLEKGPIDLEKSPIDQESLEGRVVQMRDVASDRRLQYREEMAREGISSLLVAPLAVKGMNIGVLRIYTAQPREFDRQEVDFVTAIANLSGLAIENARVYEALQAQFEAIRRAKVPWAEDFNKPKWRD